MATEIWFEHPVDDRYIKARRLIRYLKDKFGDGQYQVSAQADRYIIWTKTKLTPDQVGEIKALSARYSARSSSRIKNTSSNGQSNDHPSANISVPAPISEQATGETSTAPSLNTSSTVGQTMPKAPVAPKAPEAPETSEVSTRNAPPKQNTRSLKQILHALIFGGNNGITNKMH